MSTADKMPELKQILGAMIFGYSRPLSVKEMRKCLKEVAEVLGEETTAFAKVRESDIEDALNALKEDLEKGMPGFHLTEVGGGFVFQTDSSCGKWMKHLLGTGRTGRDRLCHFDGACLRPGLGRRPRLCGQRRHRALGGGRL